MSSLVSKQIQTECLFDVSLPFFRRIKSTIEIFFLFTFALFAPRILEYMRLNTLSCAHRMSSSSMKRANYSSLLILSASAIPLHTYSSTAIFVHAAHTLCKSTVTKEIFSMYFLSVLTCAIEKRGFDVNSAHKHKPCEI